MSLKLIDGRQINKIINFGVIYFSGIFFIHLKLELPAQFPASNEWEILYVYSQKRWLWFRPQDAKR